MNDWNKNDQCEDCEYNDDECCRLLAEQAEGKVSDQFIDELTNRVTERLDSKKVGYFTSICARGRCGLKVGTVFDLSDDEEVDRYKTELERLHCKR